MYTKISNKVVGLLLAAKKRGIVYFEGEMLFQVSTSCFIVYIQIYLKVLYSIELGDKIK